MVKVVDINLRGPGFKSRPSEIYFFQKGISGVSDEEHVYDKGIRGVSVEDHVSARESAECLMRTMSLQGNPRSVS